ncbi:MAG: glycosyltransferase family 4 protein [Ignavibacteriaceae bacterium]|jgi:glycosyltransferase involved in cell wall biosynthesis
MAKSENSILLLSVMDSWGGGEEVLLKIALHVKGFAFFIATPPGNPSEVFLEHKLNIFSLASLKKIYRKSDGWAISDKLKTLTNIVKSILPLYLFMRKKNISIIAANGNFAALFALPLVFLFKKKLVVIQHLLYEKNSFEGTLLKTLAKYSDKFICVSKSVAENIQTFIGESSGEKCEVIYNGISLPTGNDEMLKPHISTDEIRFAIVGSIIQEKGHDRIIEVFSELAKNFPQCRLYVFGEPRDERSSKFFYHMLQDKVESFKIDDKVFFKGYIADKDDLYNQIDILINYSIVPESFSMTVIEALARKKIVIASNEGGPSEILQHGVNGFLVEPRNKQALLEMMTNVVTKIKNESMNEIRNNGRATVEERFSLHHFSENYKNIFQNLLKLK